MIDHLALDVSDVALSRRFYEAALAPLGYRLIESAQNDAGGRTAVFGIGGAPSFILAEDRAPGRSTHLAFLADSRAAVDAFHAAALAAGGRDNGAPGMRARYGPRYYAAFVLDPDGLNIEAVCHEPPEV